MRQGFQAILIAIAAGGVPAAAPLAQSSDNYSMGRVGFAAGVATAESPGYQNSVTIAQDSRVGASSACNTGVRVSLGFWSIAGDLPVPIDLVVQHSPADPQDVELIWSGADEVFQVFRASSPSGLASPMNLYQETGLCAFADDFASQGQVLYYLVLARP